MNTLIAIGAAHALYLGVLVLLKKGKSRVDYILAAYLAALAFVFGDVFFAYAYELPDLMVFQLNINLLLAPLFFLYIRALIEPAAPLRRSVLLHLGLYIITALYWLVFLDSHSEEDLTRLFSEREDVERPVLFIAAIALEILVLPVYALWVLWLLRQHRKRIATAFSYTEGIDLKWAAVLIGAVGTSWLGVILVESIKGEMSLISDDQNIQLGYGFSAVFVFYLGYFGLRQGHIELGSSSELVAVAGDVEPVPEEPKYQKSGLKDAAAQARDLQDYIAAEKPYLQSRLSIQTLAEGADLSVHHLSQLINEELGQTFYDLINSYRVEEFKQRLADPAYAHWTTMAIALDCGFNSKSSFNRIFKKLADCTPSQYRAAQQA